MIRVKFSLRQKCLILTSNADYEYEGFVLNVVFAFIAIADDEKDKIKVYYGAADTCVALATGKLSDIINLCLEGK